MYEKWDAGEESRAIMQSYVGGMIRQRNERLMEQAEIFISMGFQADELTVVCHPTGEQEIAPIIAL